MLKVPRGSGAARAGVRRGDVIISVNARPVKGLDGLDALLAKSTSAKSSVLYYRDGARIEGTWPGVSAGGLDGVPLPERLP